MCQLGTMQGLKEGRAGHRAVIDLFISGKKIQDANPEKKQSLYPFNSQWFRTWRANDKQKNGKIPDQTIQWL